MRSITWRLGALALGLAVTVTAAPPPSVGAASEPYFIGATVSESVSGTYRMTSADHNGLSTFSIVVTQIENGKFTVAK